MKKIIVSLISTAFLMTGCLTSVSITTATAAGVMNRNEVRENARFLTDRMGHELNLSNAQYNDIYEINYDFIYNARYVMSDVLRGDERAMDRYYRYLDVRNDDLRWVLSYRQYVRFMDREHFYRPIYATGKTWGFRIHTIDTNRLHFYFDAPKGFLSYSGTHYRAKNNNVSHYKGRHQHSGVYEGKFSTKREDVYHNNRRSDFGVTKAPATPHKNVSTRPDTNKNRPSKKEESHAKPVSKDREKEKTKDKEKKPAPSTTTSPNTTTSPKPANNANNRPASTGSKSRPGASTSSRPSASTSANKF